MPVGTAIELRVDSVRVERGPWNERVGALRYPGRGASGSDSHMEHVEPELLNLRAASPVGGANGTTHLAGSLGDGAFCTGENGQTW